MRGRAAEAVSRGSQRALRNRGGHQVRAGSSPGVSQCQHIRVLSGPGRGEDAYVSITIRIERNKKKNYFLTICINISFAQIDVLRVSPTRMCK